MLALVPMFAVGAQAPTASTLRSNTSRLFLEVAANGSGISVDDLSDGTESGGGVTFRIGYGFSPKFALTIDGTAASIGGDPDSYILAQGDFAIRYHFADPTRAFVPFVELGWAALSASQEGVSFDDGSGGPPVTGDMEISGSGFTFGGGFLYFLNPRWAFSTGIKVTRGSFNDVTFQDVTVSGLDLNTTTSRVNIGIAWFPMKAN
jgi:hypothetical protein